MRWVGIDDPQDVSLLGPVSSLYILTPVCLGVLVLNEPLSFRKVLGVALALLAMYVLSTAEAQETKRKPDAEKEKVRVLAKAQLDRSTQYLR